MADVKYVELSVSRDAKNGDTYLNDMRNASYYKQLYTIPFQKLYTTLKDGVRGSNHRKVVSVKVTASCAGQP